MQTNMTRMARTWLTLAGLGVWLAGAGPAMATFANYVDFQGDAVGANPSLADYISETGGNVIEVVGSASTPADPFGGAGNKSLWLQDNNDPSDAAVGFRRTVAEPVGKLSLRLYVVQDVSFPTPWLELRAFKDGISSLDGAAQGVEIGPWMFFSAGSLVSPISIGLFTSGPTLTLDQTLSANTAHMVEISFNTVSDTFTAMLDGSPLTDDGGATTVFPFYSALPDLNAVAFTAGFSTRVGVRTFVDDISLIPEPATVSLVAMGGLAFVSRRRRV